jgi:hypothetical protein
VSLLEPPVKPTFKVPPRWGPRAPLVVDVVVDEPEFEPQPASAIPPIAAAPRPTV